MKTLAKAVFRKLKADGYEPKDAVTLSSELLSLFSLDTLKMWTPENSNVPCGCWALL